MPTFGVSCKGFHCFQKKFETNIKHNENKAQISPYKTRYQNDHMHKKWNHTIRGKNVDFTDGFKVDVESRILPMVAMAFSLVAPEHTFRWLVQPVKLQAP